jgi:hypothetical protein
LTIRNCREVFTKDEFHISSNSIELIGFEWFLHATTAEDKDFLGLYLCAHPPNGSNNFRIEVDWLVIPLD